MKRLRQSNGFTLIEVLVVVTMMGIIAVAIAALFGIVVRTVPATSARADDARALLGVTTWLPNDVSATPMVPVTSAGAYWDKEPTTTSGCAGTDPDGINLVRLKWTENYAGSKSFVASYRLVDRGDRSYIARIYCMNGQAPSVSKLTADLPPVDEVDWTLEWKTQKRGGVDYRSGLVFELQGLGTDAPGSTLRVDATSKNFNETLAAPIPPPDYVPIATPPPPPPEPNTAPLADGVSATFQIGTTVTVTLDVSDDYDDPATLVPTLTMPGEDWSYAVDSSDRRLVTITPPDGVAEGPYTIQYTVTDSGYPDTSNPLTSEPANISLALTTEPVVVPEPPVITPIAPEPSFQRDAEISFVVVATDPDGNDSELDVTLSIPDPATDPRFVGWAYHIDPSNNLRVVIDGGPFGAGSYPITYRVTDETGLWTESSLTITLTPIPCVATFDSANPTTANRTSNANGGRRLANPVTITINRSGDCVLTLQYTPNDITFSKSFGSSGTTVVLPATDLELWYKNVTTSLQLVRADPGTFTPSTWSLTTP